MKLSTKQYQIITVASLIVILALVFLQFGLDELRTASVEKEDRYLWDIEPEVYETKEDGTEHIIINVTFNNVKLFEDFDGTPTKCTNFDFTFLPSGGNLELQRFSTIEDVPFEESFEITYDSVMTPVKGVYGLSDNIEISVIASDEDHHIINTKTTKTISLPRSKQPMIERPIPEPEETPGFEAVFAIAGLLFIILIVKKE